ncbi:uncharacterized protein LOC118893955 [Balaenoptera musculus]|uniref:Uncharacterized protein LOC118893955 n=1 Tax=Balaenoptera musculus TaxID=9771 RepID=A0A8B8XC85_BALMU|nr:uncharacterized protein LOC118893955 [Balaenoptera musculus]
MMRLALSSLMTVVKSLRPRSPRQPSQLQAYVLLSAVPAGTSTSLPSPGQGTAKAPVLAVVLNQSLEESGEEVSPTSATYSENAEVVGPPGKMKEGRLNAGQAETTGVHCISQHTQQSHTSLPWPLFFHCLKCSSTVILLTNAYVAFKSQITRHLLLATFFVRKITPSLEPFLCLIPISIIIRLNWIFFRTINCNYTNSLRVTLNYKFVRTRHRSSHFHPPMQAKVDPTPPFVLAETTPPKCEKLGQEERWEHRDARSRQVVSAQGLQ